MFEWIIGCFTTIAVVFILCFSVVTCNQGASERYYAAQKMCIESGGSWLPTHGGSDSYGANCFRLAK